MSKKVIRSVKEYIVNNVGKVAVLTAINPSDMAENEPLDIYQGFAVLGVRVNGQVMPVQVEFDLEVSSIEEAFEKFQPAAEKQLKKQMEEAQKAMANEQKQIITATGDVNKIKAGL